MRLEKCYPSWGRELTAENTAFESKLGPFVDLSKGDFIGRAAALAQSKAKTAAKLCAFEVSVTDADAVGDEPIMLGDEIVGTVTSGGYGHFVGKSIALGFVPAEKIDANADYLIEIVGDARSAKLLAKPPFDPSGGRLRG